MQGYGYAEKVAKHVKMLLKDELSLSKCLERKPVVKLDELFCLESITWNYYDYSVIVDSHSLVIETATNRVSAVKFFGFDEFLSMEKPNGV